MTILERVQADTRDAMKARERDRVGALRMIANALQQEAKEGEDDEVAVLRRERKRRLEAATAFREGGGDERAAAEEAEAELIGNYLPAGRGRADRQLPAGGAERRGARGARGRRRIRGGRLGSQGDGEGHGARDAEGRWARPWPARERRRPRAPELKRPLARRQLTLDNTVAAELAGSEDSVLRE